MNRNTYSGSPAVKTACPNRNPKFPFRHSKTTRVNPQHLPKRAAKELCTPIGDLRRINLGRDIGPCCQHFHPRPTSFRRHNLTKTETSRCAPKPLCSDSIAHPPIAHFCQYPVLRALRVFRGEPRFPIRNPQSAIRNPQSAIRNPQSAIRTSIRNANISYWAPLSRRAREANPQSFSPRISAIIGKYRLSFFHRKQLKKLTNN
jgi:hypothetical protein